MRTQARKAWLALLATLMMALAMALPGMALAVDESTASDGTMQVYLEDQEGNRALMAEWSADEFEALATTVDAGYLYNGTKLTAIHKMVTLDTLRSEAKIPAAAWAAGSKVYFTATDGVYGKFQPTYEQLGIGGEFYPKRTADDLTNVEDAVSVPAGIAPSGQHITEDIGALAAGDKLTELLGKIEENGADGTKFGIGIFTDAEQTYDKGNRLASNMFAVTFVAPAGYTVKSVEELSYDAGITYFDGTPVTPVVVKEGKTPLTEGTDYTIAYQNNDKVGTASYTVTGMGNYVGIHKGTFEVTDEFFSVMLNGKQVKKYTKAEFNALLTKEPTLIYQRADVAYLASDYVTFEDLFKDAGIDKYWAPGSSLDYYTYDGNGKPFTKGQNPTYATYEQYQKQVYTYPNASASDTKNLEGAIEVPAVLAMKNASKAIGELTYGDRAQALSGDLKEASNGLPSIRRGWLVEAGGDVSDAPGWRLLDGIVALDLKTTAGSELFSDVKAGAWYEDYTRDIYAAGLMKGVGDTGTFGIGKPITRAEFITTLWRYAEPAEAAAYNDNAKLQYDFSDVKDSMWYTAAINWAAKNGIMNGYSGKDAGKFGTNDPIKRQDMMTTLARYLGQEKVDQDKTKAAAMPDWKNVDTYAQNPVAYCMNEGWVSGKDGNIAPKANITREEVAKILVEAFLK